jgi:hypothetical protein
MKPSGAHTHPGKGGGTALLVLAAIVGLAIAEPVARAVGSFLRVAVDALEALVIILAAAAAMAVLAKLVYFVALLRRRYAQQLATLQDPLPLPASHEPAQLPDRPAPLAKLESRLSRIERRLAGGGQAGDPLPAICPPPAGQYPVPEVGRRPQSPVGRG